VIQNEISGLADSPSKPRVQGKRQQQALFTEAFQVAGKWGTPFIIHFLFLKTYAELMARSYTVK